MTNRGRVILALVLCAAFYGLALGVGSIDALGNLLGPSSWFSESVFTHLAMLIVSLVFIYTLSSGNVESFGFHSVSPRVLPKAILAGVVTVIAASIIPGIVIVLITGPEAAREGMGPLKGVTPLQFFTSIFVLASIAEEVLFRGLIQSVLAPLATRGIRLPRVHLSVPVILAGVAFGLSHLILIGNTPGLMVAQIVFAATILGFVAGYYREKTGSIIPAIVVHMVFNIPGLLGKIAQSAAGT
jgi:membrane protease YdiL (CAAX protease family)